MLVHPGHYPEHIDLGKTLTVGSLFLTTGKRSYIEETTIKGALWHIVDTDARLSGFTVTNENASSQFPSIQCNGDAYLDNLIIKNNQTTAIDHWEGHIRIEGGRNSQQRKRV